LPNPFARALRLRTLLVARQPELRFALRATVAGFLAYLISDLLDLTQGYWSVLTAVLVMQTTVGASVKVATERLLATLLGGLCGFAAAYLILEGLLDDTLALLVLLFVLSLLAALRPAFRLAPVTAAIVLLTDPAHAHALQTALDRMLNIAVGCLVGLAVAVTVLPARAYADLRQQTAKLLRLLAEALHIALSGLAGTRDETAYAAVNDRIRAALAAVETRAQEAKQERAAFLTDAVAPDALLRTLRRLRNDQVAIGRATQKLWPTALQERLAAPLAALGAALEAQLNRLADATAARQAPPERAALMQALAEFATALQRCRDEGLLRSLPTEPVSSLFALGFAFEQVKGEFDLLDARLAELAGKTPSGKDV
jgi:uncharacterized membrane protein YccC